MSCGKFTATLEIRTAADGEPVCKKMDGERFAVSPHTVKFNTDTLYALTLTFRPAKLLLSWTMLGERVEFDRQKPSQKQSEEDLSIYQAKWSSTAVQATKRAARITLPILLEVDRGVMLQTSLQAKFYPPKETTHSRWGDKLHSIDLKCELSDGAVSVTVKEEKYLSSNK